MSVKQNTSEKISVIFVILNEERTIASLVETVITWNRANEIIVIDDEASTDNSYGALKPFLSKITYIRNEKDRGKGYAVSVGLTKANGDLVMIIDGDMTNVTHNDLDRLLHPVLRKKYDMSIAVPKFWKAGSFEPWNNVSGTRVFRKHSIASCLSEIRASGYGIEVFLNRRIGKEKIKVVRWPHVFVFTKWEKMSIESAVKQYIQEAKELTVESIKDQGKYIPPQVKKMLLHIQKYLQYALEITNT